MRHTTGGVVGLRIPLLAQPYMLLFKIQYPIPIAFERSFLTIYQRARGRNGEIELPLRELRLLVCRLEPIIDMMWVMEFAFKISRFIHLHPIQCNARLTEAQPTPLLASDFQPTDRGC